MNEARKYARKLLTIWGRSLRILDGLNLELAGYFAEIAEARDTVQGQGVHKIAKHTEHKDISDVAVRIERAIEKFNVEEQRIRGEITRTIQVSNNVRSIVFQLPHKQMKVVFKRYREGQPWDRIAHSLGMDLSSVHRLDREAVDSVIENYPGFSELLKSDASRF